MKLGHALIPAQTPCFLREDAKLDRVFFSGRLQPGNEGSLWDAPPSIEINERGLHRVCPIELGSVPWM